jgi:hypothetical protein
MVESAGYPNVVAGRSVDDNLPTDIAMDPTSFALYTGTWVWNATTLIWEKMTQPVDPAQDGTIAVPATIEIDIFHYAIHAGLGFTADLSGDINGTNINFTFKTPARGTQIHFLYNVQAAAAASLHIYAGCAVDDAGTDEAPVNRNQYLASPPVSGMEGFGTGALVANRIQANGAITVGSALELRHDDFGSGKKSGGAQSASWEFVLEPATVHGIQLQGEVVGANLATIVIAWFEVPD